MKKERIIRPPRLKPGDTVSLVAPAGPFEHKRDFFDRGVDLLETIGFNVKIPDGLFEQKGYLAGRDEHRAELLTSAFKDPAVRAVFCVRGGFGSARILSLLDFDELAADPKIIVGFSDITVLLVAFYQRSGIVTFHGPLVTTFGQGSHRTKDSLVRAVTSDQPIVLSPSKPVVLCPGYAKGPVLGGNLTNICHLTGTPYEPDLKGALLLLEDCGEAPYRIDRMLCHLRLGGRLQDIAGVIVGSFVECGDLQTIYDIIADNLADREIPVLAGFEIGHDRENMTIPIGLAAVLDTESGLLSFAGPATSL